MKEFIIVLLGAIFVVLIAGSVQSIYADHSFGGKGIFRNADKVNYVATTIDSQYQIHVQVVVRNAEGQLVSVHEALQGQYIPHEITDTVFDEMSGKREIVTVDNIKYEKIQNIFTEVSRSLGLHTDVRMTWTLEFYANVDGHGTKRLPIFQAIVPIFSAEDDILTFHWTILREMN